jgi:uncharacterized membrane protein
MKTEHVVELNRLKARLDSVDSEVGNLREQIHQLEQQMRSTPTPKHLTLPVHKAAPVFSPPAMTAAIDPPRLPPPLSHASRERAMRQQIETLASRPVPEPAAQKTGSGKSKVLEPAPGAEWSQSAMATPTAKVAGTAAGGSFEMRLGTYWLVRVGVVMVLTAMVFFGNYAYQHLISPLGPAGKVVLLYLASGLLLGVGHWLQRRMESLQNYGQVLFAGGLAAIYFTTYAAHHFPNLRVIESVWLSGCLLLGWTGYIVWLADRRKSELLSIFAIGLAFYTGLITQAGLFTLYSNLLLTLAAVFFLLRNRWTTLSFAALIASYASYAFWRFHAGDHWHWPSPGEALWTGAAFLACYWAIFTAAVFLSRDSKLTGVNRLTFLTLNNVAFFAGFLLTMLQTKSGGFWQFALLYGCVLVILSVIAGRTLPAEPATRSGYLLQGVLLITVGLIAKFSGPNLGLILAAESVVLLHLGGQRRSVLLETFGCGIAVLATFWTVFGMQPFVAGDLWLGIGVGALLLYNAIRLTLREVKPATDSLQAGPTLFVVLGLLVWLVATWNNTTPMHRPVVFAIEAACLTAAFYLVRVREIPLLGQGYLVLAHTLWLLETLTPGVTRPWWNPALVLAITLGLSHWWQRQKLMPVPDGLPRLLQGLFGVAFVLVLHVWLQPHFADSVWLVFTGLLALAMVGYGVATRFWLLVIAGQIFVGSMIWQFTRQLMEAAPGWYLAMAPVFILLLLAGAATAWLSHRPETEGDLRQPVLGVAKLYRWTALLMGLAWIFEYIPTRERFWVLLLAGAAVYALAGWRRNLEAILAAAVLAAVGLAQFWLLESRMHVVYLPNLLAILLLLGAQQAARSWRDRFPFDSHWHNLIIVLGGVSLWQFASSWVLTMSGGFYLTVAWTGIALVLFLAGLILRERMYRWLGLAVLGCAMGRVALLDVWKLEALYRTFSFFALGVVLLVLGYFYNRFQDRLRQWL